MTGMSKKDVREYFAERILTRYKIASAYGEEKIWRQFHCWILGQTRPPGDNNEARYYKHDVERFADLVLNGKPTFWD